MVDHLGNEMKVVYAGTIPNNFESSTSVVVTGKYQEGTFHAKDILTKCPSKYEEQFAFISNGCTKFAKCNLEKSKTTCEENT